MTFSKLLNLTEKFRATPLSDDEDGAKLFKTYNTNESTSEIAQKFVNWKLIFAAFVLIGNETATKDQIQNYVITLSRAEKNASGLITLETFLEIPAWFDDFEGSYDVELREKLESDESEGEEKAD